MTPRRILPAFLLLSAATLAPAAGPAPQAVTGKYWSGPEEHRLTIARESFFVAGPAAAALDRLLAPATPRGQAWVATVTACAIMSAPGRYGHLGQHRRMLSLVKLLRVIDPRGRVLLHQPGRC